MAAHNEHFPAQSPQRRSGLLKGGARMNDDLDSMNDLDSILAEFGGSAPSGGSHACSHSRGGAPPQPVSEPEAQEEKADGNTHLWRSRDLTAAARPVRKPMPMRAPVSAAPAPEKRNDAPRAGSSRCSSVCSRRLYCCGRSSTSTPPPVRSPMPPAAAVSACPTSWTYMSTTPQATPSASLRT